MPSPPPFLRPAVPCVSAANGHGAGGSIDLSSHPLASTSGTMGNLIGVGAQCRRGDEIILGKKSHLFQYEGTGASAFMGVAYHTLDNLEDGGLDTTAISGALRGDDPHYPR